ncbi:MAG TPA: hypothetical protein VMR14_18695 [Streptosporangiaceae bacterium]|nr:hypothetical protein [Streptosporangiaceae bacterium]
MRRLARLLALVLVAAVPAVACGGCLSSAPLVALPKKGAPLPGPARPAAPAWSAAQERVVRAYHAAQVALNSASDSQSGTRASVILAGYILPADVSHFVADMAVDWAKGDVSSGNLGYQIQGVTIKGRQALVDVCWPPGAFVIKSAATGKPVPPLPKKPRHSVTLMGYLNGHWLQGRSVISTAPCAG